MFGHKLLYRWSLKEADHLDERGLWRKSHKENCDCATDIERAIANAYDYKTSQLNDCTAPIIERYGFDRVNWVLANTVREKVEDGRISRDNKEWAKRFHIPQDDNRWQYCVNAHPGLTDIFINRVREAWQALGLFDHTHCVENDDELDYTDKVVVLRPEILKDEYKTPDYQLFYVTGGFGARPHSRGRKVYGRFLMDDEETFYNRDEMIGVLKGEFLPEWAAEKLQAPEEEMSGSMTMS